MYIFDDFEKAKRLRADMLKTHFRIGTKFVCFSCGNTSKAMKNRGLDVLDISKSGDLIANRWFTQDEISQIFSNRFDATCGHLPMYLMNALSNVYGDEFYYLEDEDEIVVPTGSGETLVCLAMAFPNKKFIARYNIDESTQYNEEAPLNKLVERLAFRIEFANQTKEGNTNE